LLGFFVLKVTARSAWPAWNPVQYSDSFLSGNLAVIA